jgi:hypothetical protein
MLPHKRKKKYCTVGLANNSIVKVQLDYVICTDTNHTERNIRRVQKKGAVRFI